jgi:hypothetical protein
MGSKRDVLDGLLKVCFAAACLAVAVLIGSATSVVWARARKLVARETVAQHHCRTLRAQVNDGTASDMASGRVILDTFCNENLWIDESR